MYSLLRGVAACHISSTPPTSGIAYSGVSQLIVTERMDERCCFFLILNSWIYTWFFSGKAFLAEHKINIFQIKQIFTFFHGAVVKQVISSLICDRDAMISERTIVGCSRCRIHRHVEALSTVNSMKFQGPPAPPGYIGTIKQNINNGCKCLSQSVQLKGLNNKS